MRDDIGERMLELAPPVRLESVETRAASGLTRRVFRARLRNDGPRTAAVMLEVAALPPPFLPSAAVLLRRLFTIAPGETLRVELGSTVGPVPDAPTVQCATRLHLA